MTVSSLFFFFCVFLVLSEGIFRLRPLPFSGLLPITLAAFIGLEAVILNCLSVFHAINRFSIVAVHLAVVGCWMMWVWITDTGRPLAHLLRFVGFFKRTVLRPGHQLVFPLLLLIGLAAWIYPPNNYDSLTYHMARVAHWIQNGSIAYYPTPIERQNVMGPGAEYLVLFFQLLSGKDNLAPFVQYISYILLIFSSIYIVRIIHLPKVLSPYVILLTATAPIAVMEASNTKNDLVASVMVYAILIAGARLFTGNIERMRGIDYAFAGLALAGGFLVKATSLLVVFPLIAVAFCFQLPTLLINRTNIRRCIVGSLVCAVVFSVIAGPDIIRKSEQGAARHEVYPLFSGYDAERLWNPVRVLVHNIPFPVQTRKVLAELGVKGDLITKDIYNLHEDMVGNPYQVSVFLILSVSSVLLSFFLLSKPYYRKRFLLALSPVASWALFGLVVKDQGWITRLEIPLFFLLPFSFVFLAALGRQYLPIGKTLCFFTAAASFISLAYALFIASNVPARPLALSTFWGERPNREVAYYHNANLKDEHDFFLEAVEANNCSRVGLILGPDSVDYPLTWRAMQRGIRVKHVWEQVSGSAPVAFQNIEEEFNRSCMLYVASGSREHVPRKEEQWLSAGDYHTFIRNSEWDFKHSEQTCLRIDAMNVKDRLRAQQDVLIERESDAIVLIATGNDPQTVLAGPVECSSELVVIKLEVLSPEDTVVQFFYQTKESSAYSEKSSISRNIAKGGNIIYVSLFSEDIMRPLRIDIGKKPGRYEIASLEIRTL
ncbi:MAG: hypothetical protein VR65_08060 [Desulfobulbaceae bacterium BRH_c16a]|nr:MAG: hypothetical protein VR65_08060 [Desulfobulbaceae bacterium BRH_c16a]